MAKSKKQKSLIPTEYTTHSTLGLEDSNLTTTIFLADDNGNPIVLIRFADFDSKEQAKDFVSVFKEHKNFTELGLDPMNTTTRQTHPCLLYTSPSPRDRTRSRMPSSA